MSAYVGNGFGTTVKVSLCAFAETIQNRRARVKKSCLVFIRADLAYGFR
jgi:hypothetical protein